MKILPLLPAYWELLHFHRVLLQHAAILTVALLLGLVLLPAWPGMRARMAAWRPAVSPKALLLGLGLAFLGFVGVGLLLLLDFPNSADEYSCIFLAKCFLQGKLHATTDSLSEFFHFTHIGEKDGKWFSLYPPGWPLMLALAMFLGMPWIASPLLATGTLVILYRVALRVADRRSAILACAWMATSSFFLLHAGSYYSHMACLFLLSAFTWCLLVAMQEKRGWGLYALAGLILGYAMMTRYLSSAAYATPFLLYGAHKVFRREISWKCALAFLAGLSVFNLFQFWFQYAVTGDALLPPIQYYREHERLGFHPGFTPWQGLQQTGFRVLFYAEWVMPGMWLFALLAFLRPGKTAFDRLLLWAGLLSGAAYTLYFSFGGNQYGPRYFFESIGLLSVMGAKTFFALWDRWPGARARAMLGSGLALGLAVGAGNLARDLGTLHALTAERKSLYNKAEEMGIGQSVVFVRDWVGKGWPLPPTDLTRNSPDRSDPVLYVQDLGEKNALLMEAMPARDFYLGTYDKHSGTARLIPMKATP